MTTSARYFVGIDLHKSVIQVCVLDSSGGTVASRRSTGTTLESGHELVAELTEWRNGGKFCVEAIGMNRWFVDACRAAGLEIVVADPVKLGLKSSGKKTDRRDAHEIARRLWLGDIERHAKTYYPSDEEYGGRKVERVRHKLVSIRQQLVNQLRGLLNAYRIAGPRGELYSAKNLRALRATKMPTQALAICRDCMVDALTAVAAEIEKLNKELATVAKQPKVRALIDSLPSVGPQTATTILCELGDVSRFTGPKAVAAYAGLAPRVSMSADKGHHGPITKRGNNELRWILSEWAVRLLSRHETVRAWAAPRLRRMHKNKVRVALARRLLVGVYVMLSRGDAFSLERCLSTR